MRKTGRTMLLIGILLLGALGFRIQAQTVLPELFVWQPRAALTSLADAQQAWQSGAFQHSHGDQLALRPQQELWVRFDLPPAAQKAVPQVLLLETLPLQTAQHFVTQGNQTRVKTVGLAHPVRFPSELWPLPNFHFLQRPEVPSRHWLRLSSRNTLHLRLSLHSPVEFIQMQNEFLLFWGLLLGSAFWVGGYLSFWRQRHSAVGRSAGLFFEFILLAVLSLSGFTYAFLLPVLPEPITTGAVLLGCAFGIRTAYLGILFFLEPHEAPEFTRLYQVALVFLVALVLGWWGWVDQNWFMFNTLTGFLGYAINFFFALRVWQRHPALLLSLGASQLIGALACALLLLHLGQVLQGDATTLEVLSLTLVMMGVALIWCTYIAIQLQTEVEQKESQQALEYQLTQKHLVQQQAQLLHQLRQELFLPLEAISTFLARQHPVCTTLPEQQLLAALEGGVTTLSQNLGHFVDLQHRSIEPNIQVAPFPVEPLIKELVQRLDALLPPGIILHVSNRRDLWVQGDRAAVQLVLSNLLENAVEHAQASNIYLTVVPATEQVVFSVADDGQGFSWKANSTPPPEASPPRNLGLRLCEELVAAHGQQLTKLPQPPGTTLSFVLPQAAPDSTTPEVEDALGATALKAPRGVVMVCGKELGTRRLLEFILVEAQFEFRWVQELSGLPEALSQMASKEGLPTFLVVDEALPGIANVLATLRSTYAFSALPIVSVHTEAWALQAAPSLSDWVHERFSLAWSPTRLKSELQAFLNLQEPPPPLSPPSAPEEPAPREQVVALMKEVLRLWTQKLGKNKIQLAQASGLWRVHEETQPNGRVRLRTKTLDNYLKLSSLPQVPRWEMVLQTARFVQEQLPPDETPVLRQLHDSVAAHATLAP